MARVGPVLERVAVVDGVLTHEQLLDAASGEPVQSSTRGELGFSVTGQALVETQNNDVNASVVAHRLRDNLQERQRTQAATIPDDTDCADDTCAVLAVAINDDATGVAVLRRAAAGLTLHRCSVSVGDELLVQCATAVTIADVPENLQRFDVRLHHDAEGVVGAVPGTVFALTTTLGLVRADIEDFDARADVRLSGSCILTSTSRRAVVVDLADPDNFSVVPLDIEPRTVVGLSASDSSRFVLGAGGSETVAQTPAAAQWFRLPLDGCEPDRDGLTVPGGERAQADIPFVAARSDGVVFVADGLGAIWSVRSTP
jgi:hypothetical protein